MPSMLSSLAIPNTISNAFLFVINLILHSKPHLLHDAVIAHFEAERTAALATLQVYYESSAGIGEHPQVVEEMTKQVEKLAAAEDALECLSRNFTNNSP